MAMGIGLTIWGLHRVDPSRPPHPPARSLACWRLKRGYGSWLLCRMIDLRPERETRVPGSRDPAAPSWVPEIFCRGARVNLLTLERPE